MIPRRAQFYRVLLALGAIFAGTDSRAAEANPAPPRIVITASNDLQRLVFPYPAAERYDVLSGVDPIMPLGPDSSGTLLGPTYVVTNHDASRIFMVRATSLTSNALFAATVLNRLTYGPTPDDLEHIATVGPQEFINEQLGFEGILENLDTAPPITNAPPPAPPLTNWIRVSRSGTTTGTNIIIYLSGRGRVYLDDIRLVRGTNADTGSNLAFNGDFEELPLSPPWFTTATTSGTLITNSPTSDGNAASGTSCLLLVSTGAGSGQSTGFWQPFATNLQYGSTQRFALSFSYLPVQNTSNTVLTVRLSGSSTTNYVTLPPAPPAPPVPPPAVSPLYAKLTNGAPPLANNLTAPVTNSLSDLRAYHVMHAIQSRRQLYEILVQFFDNHFTTEYQKLKDWFDNNHGNAITNEAMRANLALDFKWREYQRSRQLLLDPGCTFYDLLEASIESPAMIIYLDTILSSRSAANENYAREILELHTFGADNGYIQQDIVDLAKVWTGWSVGKKDPSNANNPFAPRVASTTNDLGVWVLHFNTNSHNYTSTKRLFTNNVVDPRFGATFRGGQPYSLIISNNAFPGTNGMREGYLVAQHLANLPYTMEFISVKLCRTFVHENFEFGVYDYTAPNLSPEAELVRDCMTAWDTPVAGRKGNIRAVIKAIFDSALFRGHAASRQKVKTPLEFAVSAVRALRLSNTDDRGYISTTADSDGYGISGTSGTTSALSRMGGMGLFNKPEPDGYSEFGSIWLNTANLAERMRFAQHLLMPAGSSLKSTDYGSPGLKNLSDPAALVRLKLAPGDWDNPEAIVDYFLTLLFPGEGAGNLGIDRQSAIRFLTTNDANQPAPFAFASNETRLRGMVAFLLCLPRFQEQ